YTQFSLEGLAHQTSQGTGGIRVPPGHRYTYYKLTDSTLPNRPAHESDFFEGLDASMASLATRLGADESKVPFLRPALESLQKHVNDATKAFSIQDPSGCAPGLIKGREETRKLLKQVEGSQLPAASKDELLSALR